MAPEEIGKKEGSVVLIQFYLFANLVQHVLSPSSVTGLDAYLMRTCAAFGPCTSL